MTWPDGHFYSSIPSAEDLARSQAWRDAWDAEETPGVAIEPDDMLSLARELADSIGSYRLMETPQEGRSYGWSNGQFNAGDAGLLAAFIAKLAPHRIVEVGAGYSTACMLDTIDHFSLETQVTSIEPFPQRLNELISPVSTSNLTLIQEPIQRVPLDLITELRSGDIFFIDSSHVAKAGSDVLWEIFQIVPRLPVGVFVHFHDILRGFEYPAQWQGEGRYWSEAYILRALLIDNERLKIRMWPAGLSSDHQSSLLQSLPIMEGRIGGSIWIEVCR